MRREVFMAAIVVHVRAGQKNGRHEAPVRSTATRTGQSDSDDPIAQPATLNTAATTAPALNDTSASTPAPM